MTKTNKSYSKRLTVTKNGKILARRKGVNHYLGKEPRGKQLRRKRRMEIQMTTTAKARFLRGL
ncbi:hypothetical protein COV42_01325 [Candidatus Campbellbacteria bacterium CG11_big_fil_rev_8_21_14_0_20_44_21]|uniref:50S ribosomal protein L35 n=1 Tax=Candidatus Campbellbacteria bacterium CG22_combo_CG10-13_8_21_14_all_43_18 TaxID=1974530 RepID=A0A2H0DWI7_9BACT|nr:MAG: hypothetical protein COW82_01640 [Candidatus Campbellbacteria bacterium CG22_combo_CG10-13_8_21_14_all_43_18]PIR24358.1 MAG: hypothetical protein COV42_01325 [Candidatus Campbellbacteria bacterium CG11_big_fil_rev_8_21_14_0_20_44_21]